MFSIIFTILASWFDWLYIFWLNHFFLSNWSYTYAFMQLFTSNFLHWWIFHLVFNSIFLYYFWNIVESIIWNRKFFIFFLLNSIFVWIWILSLSIVNTVWISGFCMAVLTYYTLHLKSIHHSEYTWGITAIVINIIIGLDPQISLLGHLLWAVFWAIFYFWISSRQKNI